MEKKYRSAKGIKGMLIGGSGGGPFFRVYGPDGSFKDFSIDHYDLEVQIIDTDAFLYDFDVVGADAEEGNSLNYSPTSLGWDLLVARNPTEALISNNPTYREYAEDFIRKQKKVVRKSKNG
jgi:hypothetical protein